MLCPLERCSDIDEASARMTRASCENKEYTARNRKGFSLV